MPSSVSISRSQGLEPVSCSPGFPSFSFPLNITSADDSHHFAGASVCFDSSSYLAGPDPSASCRRYFIILTPFPNDAVDGEDGNLLTANPGVNSEWTNCCRLQHQLADVLHAAGSTVSCQRACNSFSSETVTLCPTLRGPQTITCKNGFTELCCLFTCSAAE